MGSRVIALDTILSASHFFAGKWTPELKCNQSRELLRFLLCRFYDQGRGQFVNVRLSLAQATLARKLGLSRQWVGVLVQRLEATGWLEHYAPTLPDGTNGSTIFRAGRQLKRVLIMLGKSSRGKKATKSPAKSRWHFSPSSKEKQSLSIHQQEHQSPSPEILHRLPLLQVWLERGKTQEETEVKW